MRTIDIRNDQDSEEINRIRFASDKWGNACFVTNTGYGVALEDADKDGDSYAVEAEDLPNLALALQKAVELGWAK